MEFMSLPKYESKEKSRSIEGPSIYKVKGYKINIHLMDFVCTHPNFKQKRDQVTQKKFANMKMKRM